MTAAPSLPPVAVTGAKGFIGRNLVVALRRKGAAVHEIDIDSTSAQLEAAVTACDVVFHLAGVNRPEHDSEFTTGNVGSVDSVIGAAQLLNRRPLIVLTSSTQAALDNPYGKSKLAAEEAVEAYAGGERAGPAVIYRLPGVFGKWCRPNYNSVVATFCYNVAHGLPLTISDADRRLDLVYVDDVVEALMSNIDRPSRAGTLRAEVAPIFQTTLGALATQIRAFRDVRTSLVLPNLDDPFARRLLATYTSYLDPGDLAYPLQQRADHRGTLAELVKSPSFGQIFVSRTKPGLTRGNHYHDMKVEKFCVIDGDAIIRFRSVFGSEVTEHRVSGTDFKVVDIPPGMTHSIENVGTGEMIVLFWASERFDPARPDTYYDEVLRG